MSIKAILGLPKDATAAHVEATAKELVQRLEDAADALERAQADLREPMRKTLDLETRAHLVRIGADLGLAHKAASGE